MSEPSKEAMTAANRICDEYIADDETRFESLDFVASIIDREFAALRAKAEAADGLADEITRLRDCVGEIDAAISDGVLAAYEQAKGG